VAFPHLDAPVARILMPYSSLSVSSHDGSYSMLLQAYATTIGRCNGDTGESNDENASQQLFKEGSQSYERNVVDARSQSCGCGSLPGSSCPTCHVRGLLLLWRALKLSEIQGITLSFRNARLLSHSLINIDHLNESCSQMADEYMLSDSLDTLDLFGQRSYFIHDHMKQCS
jgi:hypothetical protein